MPLSYQKDPPPPNLPPMEAILASKGSVDI